MRVSNEDIRNGLWKSQGLTSTEKMVALCIVHFRDGKYANLSQRYIARRTGFSLRTVNGTLASLQRKIIVAIWPGRNEFCRYEFNEDVFVLNSAQPLRTPPDQKPVKFLSDHGCIPAWEDVKPRLENYPDESIMAKADFDELVRLCKDLPKPESIDPWSLNIEALHSTRKQTSEPDPLDLTQEQWVQHERMADMLMGTNEQKAVA